MSTASLWLVSPREVGTLIGIHRRGPSVPRSCRSRLRVARVFSNVPHGTVVDVTGVFRRGAVRLSSEAQMHWLQLGVGTLSTVIVPAASDGLWTAGQSLVSSVWLAWRYRRRLKTHRLIVLSRREPIPFSFDVQRHADDCLQAVEQLHWGPAVWECVSAAGPIGQWTALRRPISCRG